MQTTMYSAIVNSPVTTLSIGIDSSVTTISVTDASKLSLAPNLCTISGGENAETIKYTGISGNDLTGCTRGFQGIAQPWNMGVSVMRAFTAYDHDTFKNNIEDHVGNTTTPHGAETASTANKIALRDASGNLTAKQIISDVAIGTAPLQVTSTTKVANLNVEQVDGYDFDQSVKTTDSPTHVKLTLSQATGTAPLTVASTTLVTNLNSDLLDGQQGSYYAPLASVTDLAGAGRTTETVKSNSDQIALLSGSGGVVEKANKATVDALVATNQTQPLTIPHGLSIVTTDRETPINALAINGVTRINLAGWAGRTGTSTTVANLIATNYYVVINDLSANVTVDGVSQATPHKFTGKTSTALSWASGYVAVYQVESATVATLETHP